MKVHLRRRLDRLRRKILLHVDLRILLLDNLLQKHRVYLITPRSLDKSGVDSGGNRIRIVRVDARAP